jgi:hypothetical protein
MGQLTCEVASPKVRYDDSYFRFCKMFTHQSRFAMCSFGGGNCGNSFANLQEYLLHIINHHNLNFLLFMNLIKNHIRIFQLHEFILFGQWKCCCGNDMFRITLTEFLMHWEDPIHSRWDEREARRSSTASLEYLCQTDHIFIRQC